MKIRMTMLDLRAVVCHLRSSFVGCRLLNIYSIDKKKYLLKFGRTGVETKFFLFIDSGTRIHCTKYEREKSDMPNTFVMKIRKTIKGRVLRAVRQFGVDRIICLTFGAADLSAENTHHLIAEFFARGNILLTDGEYRVMTLLRSHYHDVSDRSGGKKEEKNQKKKSRRKSVEEDVKEDESEGDDSQFRAGKKYPYVEHHTKHEKIKRELIENIFKDASHQLSKVERKDDSSKPYHQTIEIVREKKVEKKEYVKNQVMQTLRCYSGEMIQHAMQKAGLHANTRFCHVHQDEVDLVIDQLFEGLLDCDRIYDKIMNEVGPGYLYLTKTSTEVKKKNEQKQEEEEENEGEEDEDEQQEKKKQKDDDTETKYVEHYQSYSPYPLLGHLKKGFEAREFPTFSACIDEYYSKFDAMRITQKKETAKRKVEARIGKMKKDYDMKMKGSQTQIERCERHAELVKNHLETVNKALELVNSALATTMNWEEIQRVFKEQKKEGHPVISIVTRLDFENNQITVRLDDSNDDDKNKEEEDDDDEFKKKKKKRNKKKNKKKKRNQNEILLELSKSAYGNIESIYTEKRTLEYKLSKMIEKSEIYLERSQKKAEDRLKKITDAVGSDVLQFKKQFWFQKFHWFITSDKFLVLGGRDAQTNELLVKRYMRSNDIYVHPNLHGGSSVLVKNRLITANSTKTEEELAIPNRSLYEAGVFSISHSKAWRDKIPIEAYWVFPSQVSKTAEAGEYLTTGAFMVRGKKKFFPHFGSFSKGLAMGVGLMFQIDEESLMMRKKRERDGENEEDMFDDGDESSSISSTPTTPNDEVFDPNMEFIEKEEEPEEEEIIIGHDVDDDENLKKQKQQKEEEEEEEMKKKKEKEEKEEVVEEEEELFDWSQLSETEKRRKFNKRDKRRFRKLMKQKGVSTSQATDLIVKEKIEAEKRSIMERRKQKEKKESKMSIVGSDPSSSKKEEKKNKKDMMSSDDEKNEDYDEKKKNEQNRKKQQKKKKRRGKKMRKYIDQDEEERKIRMLLMGIKEPQKPTKQHQNDQNNDNKSSFSDDKHKNKDLEFIIRRQEKERKKKKELEEMKNKDLVKEEKKQWEDETEEKKKLSEIDFLIGNPNLNDTLLSCIPVFAPFETIKHFKYAVKIMPGPMKRGTACKEILSYFTHQSNPKFDEDDENEDEQKKEEEEEEREGEGEDEDDEKKEKLKRMKVFEHKLIKMIGHNEMARCIESNVQIVRALPKRRKGRRKNKSSGGGHRGGGGGGRGRSGGFGKKKRRRGSEKKKSSRKK